MKICIVGYGRWGKNLHNTLAGIIGKENVFVYDTKPLKKEDDDKNLNILSSLDEVANFDNIIISTPATTHFDLSKKFLEMGKNIFCEKPVSLSVSEVDELIEIASKHNNEFLVGHTFLFNNAIHYIKDEIKKNSFDIKLISGRYTSYSTNVKDVDVLWDFGPHVVSISNFIAESKINSVGILPLNYDSRGKLSACNINLEYENGINSVFELSWLSIDKKREIDFIAESKMFRWNDLRPASPVEYITKIYPEQNISGPYEHFHTILNKTEIPPITQVAPLENEMNYFINRIKNNNYEKNISGLKFSRNVIDTIEKLKEKEKEK